MDTLLSRLNIYIIPPLLSFIVGWTLAIVALSKGKRKSEKILFAMVCIGWTLMSPIFISHHLLRGDFDTIIIIERSFHCVFVYLPCIYLLYLYKAFDFKNKTMIIVTAVISIFFSIGTWTPYYFSGFYIYSWGYSASGGIIFKLFGVYGFCIIIYMMIFFFKKIKASRNQTEKLKLKYVFLSFFFTALLMLLNMPAISGIDFYPFGNFMFIPLSLLAFGVLRYRLMDIRSVLHVSFIWIITSSLILIPNALLFYFIKPYIPDLNIVFVFSLLVAWFLVNYAYLQLIQPFIDRLFNKKKYNLHRLETQFNENITYLRTLDDLSVEFTGMIKKALNVKKPVLFIKTDEEHRFSDLDGNSFEIDPGIEDWLSVMNHIVEADMVKTNPYYDTVRDDLIRLFTGQASQYIIPMVQNNELIGLLFISERYNLRQLNTSEINFINSVRSTVSISMSNSMLYQDITNLKDNLENKVEERTEELLRSMEEVETMNLQLTKSNEELEEAKKISELDMALAVQVQKSLFPSEIPLSKDWDIVMEFRPKSGVSGDIYDFYMLNDNLLGLSLLDVSGHGISSGLITVIARSVISRHFFANRDKKLKVILNEANKELIDEISTSHKYLTGILIRFTDNIVEYVNAGHPDLILKKGSSGNARIVNLKDGDFKGTFLGVEGMNEPFHSMKFIVEPGDILIGFTDCIVESNNSSGVLFGMQRIIKSLSSAPPGTARDLLNHLLFDFHEFIGDNHVTDDLTVIVAQRK